MDYKLQLVDCNQNINKIDSRCPNDNDSDGGNQFSSDQVRISLPSFG